MKLTANRRLHSAHVGRAREGIRGQSLCARVFVIVGLLAIATNSELFAGASFGRDETITSSQEMPEVPAEVAPVEPSLSNPWYIFWRKLQVSIGAEACVKVGLPTPSNEQHYLMDIVVTCSRAAKVQAIATLIADIYTLGPVQITVTVEDEDGYVVPPAPFPSEHSRIEQLFTDALTGNPYFVQTMGKTVYGDVWLIFTQSLLLYYTDDIGDLWGHSALGVNVLMQETLRLKHWAPYGRILASIKPASVEN